MLPEKFHCPHCGSSLQLDENERQAKKFTCPDCGKSADLTENLDHDNLVTVFVPPSEADRLTAMSLLSEAGVSAYCRGTIVQDLLGFGRLGTGYNPVTGPVHIEVLDSDLDAAKEVLAEHFELDADGDDEASA